MNKKGFTLIELLATIVIITFIMGIVLPSATRVSKENQGKMCSAYENMMEEYAQTSTLKDQYFIELSDLEELDKVKKDCTGYVTIDYSVNPPKYNAHISCSNGCKTVDYIENVEQEKIRIDVPTCRTDVVYNGQAQNIINEGEGYTLSNEKRINVGKQNVVVNIADKRAFAWKPDGSQAEKVIRNCEIKKRPITLTAKNITFTYLDTPQAFDYTLSNTIPGENPLASAVTYQVKDSNGNNVTITSSSPAGVYTIIPSSTVTNNYSLVIQNGTLIINRKPVTFPTCNERIYSGAEQVLFDAHSLEYTNTAIKGKNIGTYTATLTPTSNYVWDDNNTTARTLSCVINPKELAINTPSCLNKTYDGNKNAGCTITYNGIVGNDSITGGATCTFSDKNVGIEKTVTCSSFTKTGTGSENYTLPSGNKTSTASINSKTITASVASCNNKTYDQGISASCTISLSGVVSGDSMSSSATCNFDNKNVGTGKTVTCSSFTKSGTDKDNYTISTTSATKIANVIAKELTVNTPSCSDKTYDGNNNASCTITYNGVISGDDVTPGATCTFDNANAGSEKTVTCSSFTKTGADNDYYIVPSGSKTTTASITAKALTITAKDQTIDYGSSIATGTGYVTINGLVSGDSLTGVTLTQSTTNVTTTGTITPSKATTSNGISNYSVTYNTGNLTIKATILD